LQLISITQRETEIAREHYAKGNQSLALLALKKRNFQKGLLDKTIAQLLNLEEMVHSIEFAAVQVQVVAGLRQGNEILNQLREEIRVEDVELLMDSTAEAIAYQNVAVKLVGLRCLLFRKFPACSRDSPWLDTRLELRLMRMSC